MNPFDLPGPQFLVFYLGLFAAVGGLAYLFRWYLRFPSDEPPLHTLTLSGSETALLAGGEQRAVDSAITRLVHLGSLGLDREKRVLVLGTVPLRSNATPLEHAIYDITNNLGEATVGEIRRQSAIALTSERRHLQELGLHLSGGVAALAHLLPMFVFAAVPLSGVVKILVGLARNRPVGYLTILTILGFALLFGVFGKAPFRSRRGDWAIAELKAQNAALQYALGIRQAVYSGDDLAFGVGLFGVSALAGSALEDLIPVFRPPPTTSGWDAWGSGSGGGCGGCGG